MSKYKDLENFKNWSREDQDNFSISVMKGLVMDATRKANSGHPGGPMSCADFAYILFKDYLNFDPQDTEWFNRDRFVLSGGHMSMLLYSLLHFQGYLNMDDLRNFRQLHSKTPGHPEVEIPGVECTTGPLGQGFGMGVGMAFAESFLRHTTEKISENSKGLVDHFTYVLASDGDVQEPVALGSASLAGHLKLSRLIVFYDANEAQISGNTNRSDSTNYATVFDGFGWHVQEIDGHDHDALRDAIEKAQVMEKPSIIIGKTIMAHGTANREGDHNTHGAPLPQEEIDATKEKLGLAPESLYCPDVVKSHFQSRYESLHKSIADWKGQKDSCFNNLEFKSFWETTIEDNMPDLQFPEFESGTSLATRKAFGATLDNFVKELPHLVGGSADLEPSNYTGNFAETYSDFQSDYKTGRNIAFGVREFPMAAAMNGMALHGGVIPFGGTFLVFADYERPALRLAAIQHCRVIHEFTHDSFWVGEDGPTHQPIEHAMALRAIPNFNVFRPADAKETAACFRLAMDQKETPSALLLTRQGVKVLDQSMDETLDGVSKGGYAVLDCENPELVFLATGSEVGLAMEVAESMTDKEIRVVSMPCWELFEQQSDEFKNELIPSRGAMKISIEAGITLGWSKYVGPNGLSIGINHFGASAPGKDLAVEFGFTADQVEEKIKTHLKTLL
jgi:transketolase